MDSARYVEGGFDDQVEAESETVGGGLMVGWMEKVSFATAMTRPSWFVVPLTTEAPVVEVEVAFRLCLMKLPTEGRGGDRTAS